jgi:uncharacterized Fe-S cluster protein YjdI
LRACRVSGQSRGGPAKGENRRQIIQSRAPLQGTHGEFGAVYSEPKTPWVNPDMTVSPSANEIIALCAGQGLMMTQF